MVMSIYREKWITHAWWGTSGNISSIRDIKTLPLPRSLTMPFIGYLSTSLMMIKNLLESSIFSPFTSEKNTGSKVKISWAIRRVKSLPFIFSSLPSTPNSPDHVGLSSKDTSRGLLQFFPYSIAQFKSPWCDIPMLLLTDLKVVLSSIYRLIAALIKLLEYLLRFPSTSIVKLFLQILHKNLWRLLSIIPLLVRGRLLVKPIFLIHKLEHRGHLFFEHFPLPSFCQKFDERIIYKFQ